MNQKVTLRFADHVLTFEVPAAETVEVTLAFRRRWPYKFIRANGDFYVHFDQVLWMKVSPGDDVEVEAEGKAAQGKACILFEPFFAPPVTSGDTHGSL